MSNSYQDFFDNDLSASDPDLYNSIKLDILSFYWDNDNHKAYGVASLNF